MLESIPKQNIRTDYKYMVDENGVRYRIDEDGMGYWVDEFGVEHRMDKDFGAIYDTTPPDDGIQHGIDDSPEGDAEKAALLGGVGGAAIGALAGAALGPLGAVAGAVMGGIAGGAASGAAVAAVDDVDNDNTVSGVGDETAVTLDSTPRDFTRRS